MTRIHTTFAALAAIGLALAAAACDDGAAPADPGAGAPAFKSFKPGGSGSAKGGAKDSLSGGAPTAAGAESNKQVKVEQGDIARLVGKTLYVLNQWRGLQVVDLADPSKPKLVGKAAMTGTPREMYVDASEAVVLVSQVATLGSDGGKPKASAGSVVRRVQLGATPKETASVPIPGYIAASKRVGDKLVIVAPQVQWNPWWSGCWGPYGCGALAGDVAVGGTTTTKAGGAATGASIAYPGGMYGGWQAKVTRVVVVDLSKPGALSIAGEAEFPGGVVYAHIDAAEVLVASQEWDWSGPTGVVTERLTEIGLDGAAKPKVGAKTESKNPLGNQLTSLAGVERIAKGRLALVRQTRNNAGDGSMALSIETWQAGNASWAKTASLAAAPSAYGARAAFDGTQAIVATAAAPSMGGEPAPQAIQLAVYDLGEPAAIAAQGTATLAEGGQDLWSLVLRPLGAKRWLVSHRGASYSQVLLRTLDLADPKAPKLGSPLTLASDFGGAVEAVGTDLLAVPVGSPSYDKGGAGGTGAEPAPGGGAGGEAGIRLVSIGNDGALTQRGLFKSSFVYWYQLKNLLDQSLLVRIAPAGLETVDVADLDKPNKLGDLDLAAEVSDVVTANGRVVALVHDWQDGKAWLRVLAKGSSDEMAPEGQLQLTSGWGRMYANGAMIYLADGMGVRVYDTTDPKAPKARGSWTAPQVNYTEGKSEWWNTYDLVQSGATVYLSRTQTTMTKVSGKDCGGSSVPPSSGGGSAGSSGGSSGKSPDSPDAGSSGSSDDAGSDGKETPGGGEPYVPTCWINPISVTRVVALDLSNPDAPKLGGEVELKGAQWVQQGQIAGKTLVLSHYVSSQGADGQWFGSYWLDRIDISAPAAPKLKDQINVPGWLVGVSADGASAVMVDWQPKAGTKPEDGKVENVLVAVTLAGGKAAVAKSLPLPDQVDAVIRSGDAIYAGTWPYWWNWPQAAGGDPALPETKLLVFDAKVPAKLAQVGAVETGAGLGWLVAGEGMLFAGLGAGLGVSAWSIATPTAPTFAAFLPTQGAWSPRVAVADKVAYVPAGWYGIAATALGN